MFGLTEQVIVVDAETASPVDLKKAGAARYFAHPRTRTLMVGYSDGPTGSTVWQARHGKDASPAFQTLSELAAEPPERVMFAAFNAPFDRRALAVAGLPTPMEKWIDIQLPAYALSFAGRLADVLAQFEIGVSKHDAGTRLIGKFSKEQAPWYTWPSDWDAFVNYCAQDVLTERLLLEKCLKVLDTHSFRPQMRTLYRQWLMDQRINERGLPVCLETLNGAMAVKAHEVARLTRWMAQHTGLDNPNSVQQLTRWCQEQGATLPNMQAQTLRDILPHQPEAVADVLRARLQIGKSSVKKFDAFERTHVDGRLKGCYTTLGASRTGRTASRGANLSNLERPKLKSTDAAAEALATGDPDLVRLLYGDDLMGVLGSCVRATIRAPEGRSLLVYDLKSIESVGLAWLAGCDTILDLFWEGKDSYRFIASEFYHKAYESITSKERTFMKPPFLGFGFGASGSALVDYAAGMGVEMSLDQANELIAFCRDRFWEIPVYWGRLESAAKLALITPGKVFTANGQGPALRAIKFVYTGTFLIARLPSGRSIFYYKPEIRRKQPRPEESPEWWVDSIHYMGKRQDVGGAWTLISTWGGMLAENVTQALCRDVLYNSLELAEADPRIEVVGSTYDEIIALADWDDQEAHAAMQRYMTTPAPWMDDRFFLGCEGYFNVERYRK